MGTSTVSEACIDASDRGIDALAVFISDRLGTDRPLYLAIDGAAIWVVAGEVEAPPRPDPVHPDRVWHRHGVMRPTQSPSVVTPAELPLASQVTLAADFVALELGAKDKAEFGWYAAVEIVDNCQALRINALD